MDSQLYGRLYMINEMLFGQSKVQIENMQRDIGTALNMNDENCYILLTGVKKREYNKRLNIDRSQFVKLVFQHLGAFLKDLAQEEDFLYDLGVLNYDYSKRIIIIITPKRGRFDPVPCARQISNMLEAQYRAVGAANPYFSNVMAVSGHIRSYEQMQSEFAALMQLHDLSFFHRTCHPLTKEQMNERHVPYSMVEAERAVEELGDAILRQDKPHTEKILHQLVLERLKPCQDIGFCQEVYFLLRQKVRSIGPILGVPMDAVDAFPHMSEFVSIEEQYDAMCTFMHKYLFPQDRKPGCPGRISVLAIAYINQNYYKPSLGLSDVAKYIHTNTAYLSRVFKQEMGIGISEYLNRLRVERAARLLRETNLKVSHVAERVGVADAHYFSSLFRRYTGTSPVMYRKEHLSAGQADNDKRDFI